MLVHTFYVYILAALHACVYEQPDTYRQKTCLNLPCSPPTDMHASAREIDQRRAEDPAGSRLPRRWSDDRLDVTLPLGPRLHRTAPALPRHELTRLCRLHAAPTRRPRPRLDMALRGDQPKKQGPARAVAVARAQCNHGHHTARCRPAS